MITISEAKKILNENQIPPRIEEIDVAQSLNRVLAHDIYAPLDSPFFTNSAMDGFAARWEDVKGAAPGRVLPLKIIGESQAGVPFAGELDPGSAIKISTGAPVPKSADTIIPVENTRVVEGVVEVLSVRSRFQHMRFQGEEFKQGDLLLTRGLTITPPKVGLLAWLGRAKVGVFSRPRIALITTGSELITSPGEVRGEFQIYDSNTMMLKSAVDLAGGVVTSSSHVRDNLEDTIAVLREAKSTCDMMIVSGGVSVGRHDHTKEAAEALGYRRLFWAVRQKPGKPLFLARDATQLFFGLPGNPVSALMGFSFYLYPVIYQFDGRKLPKDTVTATARETIENTEGRTQLLRVKLEEDTSGTLVISPLEKQGSHMLTSLSQADGFVIVDEKKAIRPEEVVDVHLFPWSQRWDT